MKQFIALVGLGISLFAHPSAASGQLDLMGTPVTDNLPLGDKDGDPTFEMPEGQRSLSPFGERPVFSPDGSRIAFIGESYGDAFEYDLQTGTIRNLTSHMAHKGFLRIHYLPDGSFILLGPHVLGADRQETRGKKIELFWMDSDATAPPVRLGATVFEGVATSTIANRIAWTEIVPEGAGFDGEGTVLKTADVVTQGKTAHLENVAEILTTDEQCFIEAQDFLPGDEALTLPCYREDPDAGGGLATEVISVELATGEITRYHTPPGLYAEVEGLLPDGQRTLVECTGDQSAGIDLCILELKETDPQLTRITRIMDFGRWRYGNPVISPDGTLMAAQLGSADVAEAGVGQGIVLITLPKGF